MKEDTVRVESMCAISPSGTITPTTRQKSVSRFPHAAFKAHRPANPLSSSAIIDQYHRCGRKRTLVFCSNGREGSFVVARRRHVCPAAASRATPTPPGRPINTPGCLGGGGAVSDGCREPTSHRVAARTRAARTQQSCRKERCSLSWRSTAAWGSVFLCELLFKYQDFLYIYVHIHVYICKYA